MKRSNTHSLSFPVVRPLPPSGSLSRAGGSRPRLPVGGPIPPLVALVAVVALAGCVSTGRYDELAAERNALAVAKLENEEQLRLRGIANESLDEQVVRLKDEREDLTNENERLVRELSSVSASEVSLRKRLDVRDQEIALTASALIAETQRVAEFQSTYEALIGDLEEELAAGEIRVEQFRDGLQVEVSQDILFDSGSASLSRDGIDVLEKVAERLAQLTYLVSVEGHSDSTPIRGKLKERYPTNWELAGARASRVVRLLVEAGVPGAKVSAVSHGRYRPVVDEESPEGRAQNRRIEIRLRPDPEAESASSRDS
jgi:chemotaxis protein MotB